MLVKPLHAHDDRDLIMSLHPEPGKVARDSADHFDGFVIMDHSIGALGLARPDIERHQQRLGHALEGWEDFFSHCGFTSI
jgi:hypothetical protein